MAISSATLFHFTSELDYLKSIIKNGFFPRYSMEHIQSENRIDGTEKKIKKAIPMVCFCDIPLSQVKDHIEFYGSYGIGLRKIWGQQKGLNPLLYLDKKSLLSNHLVDLSYEIFNENNRDKPEYKKTKKAYHEIVRYTKPYSGQYFDRNRNLLVDEYIFYNEREWRFVPKIEEKGDIPIYLKEDEFNSEEYRNSCNDLMKSNSLTFSPADISYIIVEHEFERKKIMEFIEDCDFKFAETKLLISRIQTKTQIMKDF